MSDSSNDAPEMTIGLDVGDKYCQVCVLDAGGEILEEGRVRTSAEALAHRFPSARAVRVHDKLLITRRGEARRARDNVPATGMGGVQRSVSRSFMVEKRRGNCRQDQT